MNLPSTDHLRKLIDTIRTAGFWTRLFRWRYIRDQLIEATANLQELITHATVLDQRLTTCSADLAAEKKDIEFANRQLKQAEQEMFEVKNEVKHLQQTLQELKSANAGMLKEEDFRKQEHSNCISSLNRIQTDLKLTREKEVAEKNAAELERLKRLKETWSNHQTSVKNIIQKICAKHTIEYVDKVPFKGEPDNTLKISGEYVILDAKSPGGEDMNNFPAYLKDQAERARKYIKEENVKTDVYLVVPANTLEVIRQFLYPMGDYNVYIVSLDTLEPLILCLRKIEDYEFAEQLSPEDRENICRVLGKFAHLAKRRIQIDTFFIKQFMELAYKCESDLPSDVLEKVVEFEKSEKLNPPTEKRAKQISLKELEKDTARLNMETESKGIAGIEDMMYEELNKIPLYTA